jgi:hypothetical protein
LSGIKQIAKLVIPDSPELTRWIALIVDVLNPILRTLGSPAAAVAVRSQRLSTGSIAAGAYGVVLGTWNPPFADAKYTMTATVEDPTAGASLSVQHTYSHTAAGFQVRVLNSGGGPLTGVLHVIAVHD